MKHIVGLIGGLVLVLGEPALAQDAAPSAAATVERGIAAHGGEAWRVPGTLVLAGHVEFYDPATGEVRARGDDYRMWRVPDPDRDEAHGADGKVRITAKDGERIIFDVGFDGEMTWTQDGVMPKPQADAYWAGNFGFGIIRTALNEGFSLERAPARNISGHMVELVRVIDPRGQPTVFGFDQESGFIRYMAFDSPRGFHERTYDDFVRLPDSGWVQAREVTLFYDGIKSNTVFWREVTVGEPIDPAVFAPPGGE